MKLQLNFRPVRITTDQWEPIEVGRNYDLDKDHRFMVRVPKDEDVVIIDIKGRKGRNPLRSVTIPSMSSVAGRTPTCELILRSHIIELSPDGPIFPIGELVTRLVGAGIDTKSITPLRDDVLTDSANQGMITMVSDGQVSTREIPGSGDLFDTTVFTVTGATWAIRYSGTTIWHVYLWPTAAANAEKVIEAIYGIRAGTLQA